MALNFSRQGRLRLIIAVVIVALGVASGGYWYFGHYTKTPAYSLRMIQEAIQAHDQKQFERYVDVDSVVDNASDALLEGMMDADHSLSEDARATISGFAAMFREPLRASFKNVIIEYVRTGEWGGQSGEDSIAIDSNVILTRTGLKSVDFRRIDSLEQDEEAGTATIGLRVYQEEVDGEFVLRAQMIRTASGLWQVKEITNFRDFITLIMKARQTQLKTYLEATDAILARHEANVKSADRKLMETLHRGSLGDPAGDEKNYPGRNPAGLETTRGRIGCGSSAAGGASPSAAAAAYLRGAYPVRGGLCRVAGYEICCYRPQGQRTLERSQNIGT